MDELKITAKIVLADMFAFYYKTHSFHWNVTGIDFIQLHGFFGDLYEEVHDAVDVIAEEIRAIDEFAPSSLQTILDLATIEQCGDEKMSSLLMINTLIADNDTLIQSLNKLFTTATAQNKQGLADFAASRLDVHNKHRWMLTALTK
jgi:starvation-inducible DNA-binding protein